MNTSKSNSIQQKRDIKSKKILYFSTNDFYPVFDRKVEFVTNDNKIFESELKSTYIGLGFWVNKTSLDFINIRNVDKWRYL